VNPPDAKGERELRRTIEDELRESPSFKSWLASAPSPAVISKGIVSRILAETSLDLSKLMVALLPQAEMFADPQVSKYPAACTIRGASGAIYLGANGELAGLPLNLTIHAEQTAAINAWEHGESRIMDLAVTAAPCGQCRQFLFEIEHAGAINVIVRDEAPSTLGDLLPAAFGPRDLNKDARWMVDEEHALRLPTHVATDRLVEAALKAAKTSYAPYTDAFAGVSLETATGNVYSGRYVENAAFNPSVLAITAALAMMRLAGEAIASIKRAVLVDIPTKVSQQEITRIVLNRVSTAAVVVVIAEPIEPASTAGSAATSADRRL
jgi:cytidine deaminase